MTSFFLAFIADDQGQDLTEYSLLLAFVVVTMFGLVMGIGDSVHNITSLSESQLQSAKTMVS